MKKILAMVGIAAALTGCDSGVQKTVRAALNDPESAQFKDEISYKNYACISVNARNKMGGYAGFRRFSLIKRDVGWEIFAEGDECDFDTLSKLGAAANEAKQKEDAVLALLKSKGLIDQSIVTYTDIKNPQCAKAAQGAVGLAILTGDDNEIKRRALWNSRYADQMKAFESGKCEEVALVSDIPAVQPAL